jgi:D-inositol-3-phosphate glycosyltransferase
LAITVRGCLSSPQIKDSAFSIADNKMLVTLIAVGGGDLYYELGLCKGLLSNDVNVEFIGSDSVKQYRDLWLHERVTFINLRGSQEQNAAPFVKAKRVFAFYLRLIRYAWTTRSKIFHIQWMNKFECFDRVFINLLYKFLGKKIIFTAHNVNAGFRDGNDGFLNRFSLKIMYRLVNLIIVHTNKMKDILISDFGIPENKVAVVQYGINDMVFHSALTRMEARQKLNISPGDKIALFFGNIVPYKGLEYLLAALSKLKGTSFSFKLVVAGKENGRYQSYNKMIREYIEKEQLNNYITYRNHHIEDKDIEVYLKAADVLVMPYKYIYQSGVLFLAYSFGIPVIASDVGSFEQYIEEGKSGYIFQSGNVDDLVGKIQRYFQSDLFGNMDSMRREIRRQAREKYAWRSIGKNTRDLYEWLIQ